MEKEYGPLHTTHVDQKTIIINRTHMLAHSIALACLIQYRVSHLLQYSKRSSNIPTLVWFLVFASELLLSVHWILNQAFYWRPVHRTANPKNLPEDDKLPAIDVFICTSDPGTEPTVMVMNTVLSAMALDYPPEKLNVYLSDDSGSTLTLDAMREAYAFAKWWLPFCRKYKIKTGCPEAYFMDEVEEEETGPVGDSEYISEKERVKKQYDLFEERVIWFRDNMARENPYLDHPSVIQVIQEKYENERELEDGNLKMPRLIYVAREKRPSYPHHFKAGALNVLLRASGAMSNSPYILTLDCDMFCNDPSSARQAMCFHLDTKMSRTLAFVQFPQRFHNINTKNDIYDSKIRWPFGLGWQGLDGLKGPILSGSGFYIKRDSLYGKPLQNGRELKELREIFGRSNEFLKHLHVIQEPGMVHDSNSSSRSREIEFLAGCNYEIDTKWGIEVGFLYHSVTEDYLTGFELHCKGWSSVYCSPLRAPFLGTSTTNLHDLLTQGIRWSSGLLQVGLSKFCPLIYGPLRMSVLESMGYSEVAFFPLCYFLSLMCLAIIPQLCLVNGIPIYPQASSWYFAVFLFIFVSSLLKHLFEVTLTGDSVHTWINEQRIWMTKSVTCHMYGSIDAIMKSIGMRKASFKPTNKVNDDEQTTLYQMGLFDFRTSSMFLIPMVTLVFLNMVSLIGGLARVHILGGLDQLLPQIFLTIYILLISYPVIEGMALRKDKGRISSSVTMMSVMFSLAILLLGSFFMHFR